MIFDSDVKKENFTQLCAQAKRDGIDGFCFSEPKVYKGLKILSACSVEFDKEPNERTAVEVCGFDYVINSVKSLWGIPLDKIDYSRCIREEVYSSFLQKVFDSFDTAVDFSVLGNVSLISKFAPYPLPNIEFNDFPELIDNIIMRTIYAGKGLEVDVSLAQKGILFPSVSILKHYRSLGGEMITLASCRKDFVGKGVQEAHELLKNAGFEHFTVFENMLPEMFPL